MFSVIIPFYNASCHLSLLNKSIEGNLNFIQEVIIVDDFSDLNEAKIVEKACRKNGWTYCRNTMNLGAAASRNQGLRLSSGTYIAFLDADDFWVGGRLQTIAEILDYSGSDAYMNSYTTLGSSELIDQNNLVKLKWWNIIFKNRLQPSCFCMRNNLGLFFDESMRYCEDYDFLFRLVEEHSAIYDPTFRTFLSREQGTKGGLSGDLWNMRLGEIKTFTKFCLRRRYRLILLPILYLFSATKFMAKLLINKDGQIR